MDPPYFSLFPETPTTSSPSDSSTFYWIELVPDLVWYKSREIPEGYESNVLRETEPKTFKKTIRVQRAKPGQEPSLIWTTIIVGTIHLLFEIFR